MSLLPNQASFELGEEQTTGEANIILAEKELGFVHANFDNPKTEFDIIVEDMAGNQQFVKRGCKNPSGRWGEKIDLPISASYCKIKVENVKNGKKIDLFFD